MSFGASSNKENLPPGAALAATLIKALEQRQCDYTLLFLLRHPYAMRGSEVHEQLAEFLAEFRVSMDLFRSTDVGDYAFVRDFFQQVRTHFTATGVQPIAPRHIVWALNKGGKARLLEKYQAAQWPKPHQPYFGQTMGTGEVLFFATQTWQDGLIWQRDMLAQRQFVCDGKAVDVLQVYEHQLGQPLVVNLIVDWEIMLSAYEERLTLAQVQAAADRFPEWLVGRLREVRALSVHASVECVVKDKTRTKASGDVKISRHFIFNVSGMTMRGHYQATKQALDPWIDRLQEYHRRKTLAHVSDADLQHPVWGWDHHLLRGQNGIATLFGCKKEDAKNPVLPRIDCRHLLAPGKCDVQRFRWSELDAHSIEALGAEGSLVCLFRSGYTTPKADAIAYDPDFVCNIDKVSIF